MNQYQACLYSFECTFHGDSNSNEIDILLKIVKFCIFRLRLACRMESI